MNDQKTGEELIAAERRRQIDVEGFSLDADKENIGLLLRPENPPGDDAPFAYALRLFTESGPGAAVPELRVPVLLTVGLPDDPRGADAYGRFAAACDSPIRPGVTLGSSAWSRYSRLRCAGRPGITVNCRTLPGDLRDFVGSVTSILLTVKQIGRSLALDAVEALSPEARAALFKLLDGRADAVAMGDSVDLHGLSVWLHAYVPLDALPGDLASKVLCPVILPA